MAALPTEKSPLSPTQAKTVNFSDLQEEKVQQEDQADCEDQTLPWDKAEDAVLSDDAKLATTAFGNEPPELARRPSLLGNGRDFYPVSNLSDRLLPEGDVSQVIGTQWDEEDNQMPDVAKQVFVPHVQVAVGSQVLAQNLWNLDGGRKDKKAAEAYELEACGTESRDPEKQAFLSQDGPGACQHEHHACQATRMAWPEEGEVPPGLGCCGCKNCASGSLKAVASFLGAAVVFPCLLYGAYVFLPFDVPLMPGMSTRLVYTLRCGVFATFPIVIGLIIYGASCLCFSSTDPFHHHHGESFGREREVELHRHYVTQSIQLFVLYFFNMAVLATYLPQETLKLIPLLTGFFALSRLIYWLSFAVGRAFRGFGYGLTFLPLLAMLVCNLYFIFVVEPDKMFAVEGGAASKEESSDAAPKLRMWG
ncbi:transmembrane protein 79 [Rhinatrema bivittatum]|uniref:transmembrane protein 79 n=1 Tax=Rhinatrema bivittatum TaxID=194408 RepID=UPI00112DB088|nr:transmembrane protein 79 [Rhinatrema bivittatum]XP_029437340.1 transmembrane protein 79 [Rhinatrema bivittatum]XP_029437341.1 transmembrane protein 79 [Rhinatrema bivittatum]